MVIYRSIGYVHNCPQGGCLACKEAYSAPPPDPENFDECCSYVEQGQRYTVVVCETPAPLLGKPKRPRKKAAHRGRAATRKVVINPAPSKRRAAAVSKKSAPVRKTVKRRSAKTR